MKQRKDGAILKISINFVNYLRGGEMKVAFVKDFEIYNEKLLGLTLRDRIRNTLKKAGFEVRFLKYGDKISLDDAEAYLIIFEPILIIERDLQLEGEKILVSNDSIIGYLIKKDLKYLKDFNNDLDALINRFRELLAIKGDVEKKEIWALKLSKDNLKMAEELLLSSLEKSKKTGLKPAYYDGIVAKMINRKLSLRLSKIIADKNVSPNQITVFSFFLSVLGSTFFLFNTYLTTFIAGVIIQLHNIVDGCDGEIARLKFMESKYGAWLDGVLDRYSDFIIIFSITYSLVKMSQIYWIIGFIAIFACLMIAYTGDKFVVAYKRTYAPNGFEIPITRDVRLFIIFLGAILNY